MSVDDRNAAFWDELCGTQLARQLGITGNEPDDLRRFDDAYMSFYPYLPGYLDRVSTPGSRVLEIGLGYGTVGQLLAERGVDYHGLDIAPGPVRLMQHRLALLDRDPANVTDGSASAIPHEDESFDAVVSIGCLHHTGDLAGGVAEIHRVLRPAGTALVMVYNRHSFRQVVHIPALRLLSRLRAARPVTAEAVRAMYDASSAGEAAPHTDFVSLREARSLFSRFAQTRIRIENFETYVVRRLTVRRELLLWNLGRVLGLDLYIVAKK